MKVVEVALEPATKATCCSVISSLLFVLVKKDKVLGSASPGRMPTTEGKKKSGTYISVFDGL